MTSPDNALQKGLYDRLTGYAPLTAALGGAKVYDFVPESVQPPYAVIGEDTLTDWDTKDRQGWEITVTVHCWDFEKAGRKSVKTLLGLEGTQQVVIQVSENPAQNSRLMVSRRAKIQGRPFLVSEIESAIEKMF